MLSVAGVPRIEMSPTCEPVRARDRFVVGFTVELLSLVESSEHVDDRGMHVATDDDVAGTGKEIVHAEICYVCKAAWAVLFWTAAWLHAQAVHRFDQLHREQISAQRAHAAPAPMSRPLVQKETAKSVSRT